jgi:hypothetical protein
MNIIDLPPQNIVCPCVQTEQCHIVSLESARFRFCKSAQEEHVLLVLKDYLNPLTPELNPSAQRCLTSFFTGNFAS